MPPVDRNNPLRAKASESGLTVVEFFRAFPDVYKGFRRHQVPPPLGCAVLIGRRDIKPTDDRIPYVWFVSEGHERPFPQERRNVRGYRTLLTIGHLVIDVVGIHAPNPVHVDDMDRRLIRIWPVTDNTVALPQERFQRIEGNDLV